METFLGIDYPTLWFMVISLVFIGYIVLDGLDFGAGIWHLLLRKEEHKQTSFNAIGPIWDGNEVWLVIGGGALFAGFPLMYASFFSALYIPFMLFLFVIIFRAASIEFRGKEPMKWWKKIWDIFFGISSTLIPILLGVVLGNIVQGIELDTNFIYRGNALLDFLTPYSLIVGVTALAVCIIHGGLFMLIKTEGDMHQFFQKRIKIAFALCFLSVMLLTVYTFSSFPHLTETYRGNPVLWLIPGIAYASFISIFYLINKQKYTAAFLLSSLFIVSIIITATIELYPVLLPSTGSEESFITIYNAASSEKTLKIMLIMSSIGIPLLVGYTLFAYKVFSGKTKELDY